MRQKQSSVLHQSYVTGKSNPSAREKVEDCLHEKAPFWLCWMPLEGQVTAGIRKGGRIDTHMKFPVVEHTSEN
jgi:hypothetical protein